MWQVGFWEGAQAEGLMLSETVRFAASTSAGCAMATACMLNRGQQALDLFVEMTDRNPSNIHWKNLGPSAQAPLLPHIQMYREALEVFLTPADLQKLEGKTLAFLIARFPSYLPQTIGTMLAFLIYGLDKHLTGDLHPSWTRKLGFQPIVEGNREANTLQELVSTILAASCVPPVLPHGRYKGMRVLDGGIIDNAPAYLADNPHGRQGKLE